LPQRKRGQLLFRLVLQGFIGTRDRPAPTHAVVRRRSLPDRRSAPARRSEGPSKPSTWVSRRSMPARLSRSDRRWCARVYSAILSLKDAPSSGGASSPDRVSVSSMLTSSFCGSTRRGREARELCWRLRRGLGSTIVSAGSSEVVVAASGSRVSGSTGVPRRSTVGGASTESRSPVVERSFRCRLRRGPSFAPTFAEPAAWRSAPRSSGGC
jgi:hypothetical protein